MGNMDVCEVNNVDLPNSLVACEGNMDVCEVNNVDHQNSLVACEGNKDAPIRDPISVSRKGKPRSKRYESHVDKCVQAKKRKYVRKNVKKKQPADPYKDEDVPQNDLLNVIPGTVEMAPVYSWYNTQQLPQNHMTINQNYQAWRGLHPIVLNTHQRQDFRASQIYQLENQALCEGHTRHGYQSHLSVLSRFIGRVGGIDEHGK